jgi:16S rRNA (uracil1498-N3)-methyltransferase
MHRIWINGHVEAGNELTLDEEETRRLRKVLRLKPGQRLTLFNVQGMEGEAEIVGFSSGCARLKIVGVEEFRRESMLRIHLIQALPKMDKMAWVIQKATELGAQEIGILLSRRCIPRWVEKREGTRMSRWRRITLEAARQSGRTAIPTISGPWDLDEFCRYVEGQKALKLVLNEKERTRSLRDVLGGGRPVEIWVVVGPEGGLEESEVKGLEKVGFQSIRVGPRVLRTETAGIVALTILQYQFGDLA